MPGVRLAHARGEEGVVIPDHVSCSSTGRSPLARRNLQLATRNWRVSMEQSATSAGASAVERLIRPRSVAIVGASSDPRRTGGRPLRYLLKHGYGGTIWPVNPRAESLEGVRCYP